MGERKVLVNQSTLCRKLGPGTAMEVEGKGYKYKMPGWSYSAQALGHIIQFEGSMDEAQCRLHGQLRADSLQRLTYPTASPITSRNCVSLTVTSTKCQSSLL